MLDMDKQSSFVTIDDLCKIFDFEFKGNSKNIQNLGAIQSKSKNLLTFAENEKFLDSALKQDNISTIITKNYPKFDTEKTLILSDSPRHLFYQIHSHLVETSFYGKKLPNSISKTAQIHPTVVLADNNVIIKDNVIIDSFVSIYKNCIIDEGVNIKSNTVLGGTGFESYLHENKRIPVPHAGGVHIEKNVNIGANTCIEEGLFRDFTRVGKYSQIDNLVLVGHRTQIGQNTVLTANSTIGGSCVLGDNVFVGLSATIKNGVTIGSNSTIGMGAAVVKDVPNNTTVIGNAIRSASHST